MAGKNDKTLISCTEFPTDLSLLYNIPNHSMLKDVHTMFKCNDPENTVIVKYHTNPHGIGETEPFRYYVVFQGRQGSPKFQKLSEAMMHIYNSVQMFPING